MRSRGGAQRLLLASFVTAGACDRPGAEQVASFSVDTLPSGLIRVENDGTGQWVRESQWTLTEDLRLGSIDGSGPELFSQVAYIETDAQDRIYVLDYPSQEIRVFSPSGEFLVQFGGEGGGPGEIESAAGLDWGPDGRLWVWGSSHYFVLEPSGEEVARYPRHVRGVIYPWMGGFADGKYVDWGIDREITGRSQDGQLTLSGHTMFYPIVFTPPDQFDTLPMLEFHAEVTADGVLKRGRSSLAAIQASDGNVWFSRTNEYIVYKRTLQGDTLLAFTRPARPMPVPDSEIDSLVALAAERPGPGARVDRDSFVPYRWVVAGVFTDDQGLIYIFPQEEGIPQGTVVDVFQDSGVFLGRMTLPDQVLTESPPPHITKTHLYAVVQDAMDVPFVVRYRINRPDGI